MNIIYLLSILIGLGFFPLFSKPDAPMSIVNCTGQVCNALGTDFRNLLTDLPNEFQKQYISKNLEAMNHANGTSNAFSGITGVGSVNAFQVGMGLNGALYQDGKTDFKYRGIELNQLPVAGFGITPNIMGAVNLGWILGQGRRDEGNSFLHRFNIYGKFDRMNFSSTDIKGIIPTSFEYRGNFIHRQTGVMLRYDAIKPSNEGFFLRFSGLNIGVGYSRQTNELEFQNEKNSNTSFKYGDFQGSWVANSKFMYKASVVSIPVDIRTGILLMRMFTIYTGFGAVRSEGIAELELSRSGVLKMAVDPLSVFNSSTLKPSSFIPETLSQEGFFSVQLKSRDKSKFTTSYILGGVEIDIWKMKILLETYLTEKTKSASIGLKFDL
jgi:hypothetical protein